MTKEQTAQAIKIMQKYCDGATIQIKGKTTSWIDFNKDEEILID